MLEKTFQTLLYGLIISFIWQCSPSQNSEDQDAKSKTPPLPKREISEEEKPFVGTWSTVFKARDGTLVYPKQNKGNYLEYAEDGIYQLYRDFIVIRRGTWRYDASEQMLKIKTENHPDTTAFLITSMEENQLEMTDQSHGYELVYIPYQPDSP